jgi:hypothetical protein
MAGCHLLHRSGGRFLIAGIAFLFFCARGERAYAEDSFEFSNVMINDVAAGPEQAAQQFAPQQYAPQADLYNCCCCPELGCCECIKESIFGCPDPCCWYPLPLGTLLSEGWNQAWVPSPNGSGGAPRQGWINAADGNMYRLMFFTYAQGFNSPPKGDAYLGSYTLLTPFSRRLMLITNVPFAMRNSISGGLPTVEPQEQSTPTTRGQTTFGDVSFTPRVLLHETQDFSVTFDLTILTPTGNQPLAGKTGVTPTLAFWYNLAGGWVIRGGIGDFVPTDGSGPATLISQLAIGQTLTDHDVPWFGDFTYYVSMVANSPINAGTATSITLTPGLRTHLGNDWYFLAGLPTPVTTQRVADFGMIYWFMKAW